MSPVSINMTVTLLAAILEGAVERELIPRQSGEGAQAPGSGANTPPKLPGDSIPNLGLAGRDGRTGSRGTRRSQALGAPSHARHTRLRWSRPVIRLSQLGHLGQQIAARGADDSDSLRPAPKTRSR